MSITIPNALVNHERFMGNRRFTSYRWQTDTIHHDFKLHILAVVNYFTSYKYILIFLHN